MVRSQRVSATAVVTLCLLTVQWAGPVFANEPDISPSMRSQVDVASPAPVSAKVTAPRFDAGRWSDLSLDATADRPASRVALDLTSLRVDRLRADATSHSIAPVDRAVFSSGQVYPGRPYPYPYRHRDAALAAMMIGAAAAITGTALLVYANRPECSFDPLAGGCGYGYKVVGTSVLAGGLVGVMVGALAW